MMASPGKVDSHHAVFMNARPRLPHLRRMLHVGPYGGELPVALRATADRAAQQLPTSASARISRSCRSGALDASNPTQ